jgi:penicillin-binding protein-related factor A (putative recombinase)
MTPEREIQNQICSYLRLKGAFVFIHDSVGIFDVRRGVFRSNRSPYRIRGVADLLGIYKGRPLAVEVKTKTGRVSPHQQEFLKKWTAAGGIGFVARSVEDVIAALSGI